MSSTDRNTPQYRAQVAARLVEEAYPKIDFSLRITREEYQARWATVQAALKAAGFSLLYVCGSELDRSDIAWLAGVYDPIIERYGLFLPAEGQPIILAGSEGGHVLEEAAEASGAEIRLLKEFQISDEEYRHAQFSDLKEIVAELNLPVDNRRVAVGSSPEFLPLEHYRILTGAFGEENVVFAESILQKIKYAKTPKELAIIQQADIIADAAFRGMLAAAVPGARETDIAGVGEFIMKSLGSHRLGFPTIVTSGYRNYTVIGPATDRVIEAGEMVSLGISPTWHGYHGILRRTIRVGAAPTPEQRELIAAVEGLYRTVVEAAAKAAAEGFNTNTIDQAGKAYLEGLRLRTVAGELVTPKEPYTFIHNTGCSECQEGFGAVTPHTSYPFAERVAEMIDVALLGFEHRGEPVFPTLYAVVEDGFWKDGKDFGVYNSLPLDVQPLVGDLDAPYEVNPYYKPYKG
ncbi:MAG TPA: M24 family metallopeptidase [Armatimonadota bacterium]|jgi:Xaa-Pro aminopeptidase